MANDGEQAGAGGETGGPVTPPTPVTVRADRTVAWTLVGVAAAIIAVLWVMGRTGPPWTLEGLLLARVAAPIAGAPTAEGPTAPEQVEATLARNDVADERKLALLDDLARDPSEAATETLLRAARHRSLLLSMAALKGLTGRSCARLEPDLGDLLRDADWQRRAWAAKVLGESGCARAGGALSDRWRAESDGRVREQIADAMSALRAAEVR